MNTENKRLFLRQWNSGDLAEVQRLLQEISASDGDAAEITEEKAALFLTRQMESYQKNGMGLQAIALIQTGEVIGQCGLLPFEGGMPNGVQLHIVLRPRFRGYGFATEAAIGMIHTAFTQYNFPEIYAAVPLANGKARSLAARCGMTEAPMGGDGAAGNQTIIFRAGNPAYQASGYYNGQQQANWAGGPAGAQWQQPPPGGSHNQYQGGYGPPPGPQYGASWGPAWGPSYHNTNSIDGYTVDEMRSFVGYEKADYYIANWNRRPYNQFFKGWNWPAFLVPIDWCFYRKLYAEGAALLLFQLVLLLKTPVTVLLALVGRICCGAFANGFYYKKAGRVIHNSRAMPPERKFQFLSEQGGISWLSWLCMTGITLLFLFLF